MQPEDYSGGGGLDAEIDLYEEDILAIQRVITALSQNIGKQRNLEGFRQEVINRFGEIGFEVDVKLYEAQREGEGDEFIHPSITITGRIEPEEEFDHARQARQVQTNIRGIKGAETVDQKTSVSMSGSAVRDSAFTRSKSGLYVPGK